MTHTCPTCNRAHCPSISHEFRSGVDVCWCAECGREWRVGGITDLPASYRRSLHDAPITTYWQASQLSMPLDGCAYRGTLFCITCPWADEIERDCDYNCPKCDDNGFCPCSRVDQTARVESELRKEAK